MNSPFGKKKGKRKRGKEKEKSPNLRIFDKKAFCKNFTTCLVFLSPLLNEITEEMMPFCKCVDNETEFSIPTLFSQQALLTSSHLSFGAKFGPFP